MTKPDNCVLCSAPRAEHRGLNRCRYVAPPAVAGGDHWTEIVVDAGLLRSAGTELVGLVMRLDRDTPPSALNALRGDMARLTVEIMKVAAALREREER